MRLIPFLQPRFCGARFETNAMPVEVLPELLAYRDLVIAVAAELYRQCHPLKGRLPKGFGERFVLEVRRVDAGSAVPLLERAISKDILFHSEDEFEKARGLITEAIAAVSTDQPLPESFPRKALGQFNAMGRRLKPDEYVLLNLPGTENGPRFDRAIRSSFVLLSSPSYTDDIDLIAEVKSLDVPTAKISIRLADGPELALPYTLSPEDLELLDPKHPRSVPIAVKGEAVFNRDRKIESILRVDEVALLGPEFDTALFDSSLRQLTSLQDGWYDGEGQAYPASETQWLRHVFLALALRKGLPLPVVFPVEPGVVRAEWRRSPMDVSAEISLATREAYVHALNLETDQMSEHQLALDAESEETPALLVSLLPLEV